MRFRLPKLWIIFFLIIVALVAAILATEPTPSPSVQTQTDGPQTSRYATFDAMLASGDNAVYVENQTTGSTFVQVGFVVLSQPGFVVIYDNNEGVPGSIIGESKLLESGGEHLVVPVSESLVKDQVYYAMLYHDDGDGRFEANEDDQALDSEQSVVLMTFIAIPDATPEVEPVVP